LTDKISIKKLVGPIFNPTHHSIRVCLVVLVVGKVLVRKRCGEKLGFSVWSIPCQKLVCMVMYRIYYHHNQPVVSARNTKNCIHQKNYQSVEKTFNQFTQNRVFFRSGLSGLSFCSCQNTRCDILGLPVLSVDFENKWSLCFKIWLSVQQ
jgi:hypothetical protein